MSAYLRFPTIFGDAVVFACEDDLWMVPATGGRACRLTAGRRRGELPPAFARRGDQLAFVGREEGPEEVYVMPADGRRGPAADLPRRRAAPSPAGIADGADRVRQRRGPALRRQQVAVPGRPRGRLPRAPAVRPGQHHLLRPRGRIVLGRNTADPARWKRYRGGTAGDLWIDPSGDGRVPAADHAATATWPRPCWVGDRVYFLSDHEGVGNVYSCTPDGDDLRRHTDHDDFYARNLSSDGQRLVYHAGADLYLLDPADGRAPPDRGAAAPARAPSATAASCRPSASSTAPRSTPTAPAWPSPRAARRSPSTTGRAPVRQHGEPDGVRYRLLTWLNDGERLVAAASDDGDARGAGRAHRRRQRAAARLDGTWTYGRVVELEVVADRRSGGARQPPQRAAPGRPGRDDGPAPSLARPQPAFGRIEDLAWSPDGRWLAYGFPRHAADHGDQAVPGRDRRDRLRHPRRCCDDVRPAFDPDGNYLYFIGQRDFDPVYDELQFDLGFPLGTRPLRRSRCARTCRSPVRPRAPAARERGGRRQEKAEAERRADEPEPRSRSTSTASTDRVLAVPGARGQLRPHRRASRARRCSRLPGRGQPRRNVVDRRHRSGTLDVYDFEKQKQERLVDGITDFALGRDGKTLLYRAGERLRVLKAGEKPRRTTATTPGPRRAAGSTWAGSRSRSARRPSGGRCSARPGACSASTSGPRTWPGVDWDARLRALPAAGRSRQPPAPSSPTCSGRCRASWAPRTPTRCGGEYRPGPDYRAGLPRRRLGLRRATARYRHRRASSAATPGTPRPPRRSTGPGVDVRPGDAVLAINGQPVGGDRHARRAAGQPGRRRRSC